MYEKQLSQFCEKLAANKVSKDRNNVGLIRDLYTHDHSFKTD